MDKVAGTSTTPQTLLLAESSRQEEHQPGATTQLLERERFTISSSAAPPATSHQKKVFAVMSKTGSSSSKAPHSIACTLEVFPLVTQERMIPTSIAALVSARRMLWPRSSLLQTWSSGGVTERDLGDDDEEACDDMRSRLP